jgi:hypothetical protein
VKRLILVAVATAGCTTGEGLEDAGLAGLAGAACRHARECGCLDPVREDPLGREPPPQCEADLLEAWPDEASAALVLPESSRPVFDAQCLETLLDVVEGAGCGTDFERFWLDVPCALYHGTRNVGDECEATPPVVSYCLPGLNCVAGRCEPGHVAAPTETLPGPGAPCDLGLCADGAWCDIGVADDPICRRLGAVGESCAGHQECETLYCPAGRCDERPTAGKPCGAQELCAEGLICVDDRCEEGALACVPPSVFQ